MSFKFWPLQYLTYFSLSHTRTSSYSRLLWHHFLFLHFFPKTASFHRYPAIWELPSISLSSCHHLYPTIAGSTCASSPDYPTAWPAHPWTPTEASSSTCKDKSHSIVSSLSPWEAPLPTWLPEPELSYILSLLSSAPMPAIRDQTQLKPFLPCHWNLSMSLLAHIRQSPSHSTVSSSNALSSIAEWDVSLQREVRFLPLATFITLKIKKLPDS